MGYVKNVFDTTAVTGTFLNSDDTGLTTNISLTDPRLFGVRVTKHFGENGSDNGSLFNTDGKLPTLWVTLGGNFNAMMADGSEIYSPDYTRPDGIDMGGSFALGGSGISGPAPAGTQTMTELMVASGFPVPLQYAKPPNTGFDWEGKLALQPQGSNWVLKAGVRYGRSGRGVKVYESEIPGTRTNFKFRSRYVPCTNPIIINYDARHSGAWRKFVNATGEESEQHTIMDFEDGVNIGIGLFGKEEVGNIAGGLCMAQFKSHGDLEINSGPEYVFTPEIKYHNVYESRSTEDRDFQGIGPELNWDASQTVLGKPGNGEVTLDWEGNGAVLFGRQSVNAQHFSSYCHENGTAAIAGCVTAVNYAPGHSQVKTMRRTRHKVVPNLGGYIGASARYNNAKIGFGYRADTFFGAMNGGQETHKDYNRGFYSPYMNVSIGLGG